MFCVFRPYMIQGPKLMFPKYGPHDIIAEQTPSERVFSVGKSKEKTKKFMSERAPLYISGGGVS